MKCAKFRRVAKTGDHLRNLVNYEYLRCLFVALSYDLRRSYEPAILSDESGQ